MMHSDDTLTSYVAEYFTQWQGDRLRDLQVCPPYEPRDRQLPWVRGQVRTQYSDGIMREFVVTGPKMRVCFSGCNWNRIVFAMNGAADHNVYAFERWLRSVAERVRSDIWWDPPKFKPGSVTNSRFTFDEDFIKPSSDPSLYPDELRCRLSTRRVRPEAIDPNVETSVVEDIVDADLRLYQENGSDDIVVDPKDIVAGSYVIPVIKISYYRNGERFGLVLTLIKGLVFPPETKNYKINNHEWVMDFPMEILN